MRPSGLARAMLPASTGRFVVGDASHARFVVMSGDTSPLHVDMAYARRTPVGQCVVHGAHVVLDALACLPGEVLTAHLAQVTAAFRNPVVVGQSLAVAWDLNGGEWIGTTTSGSLVVAEVRALPSSDPTAWPVVDSAPPLDSVVAAFVDSEGLGGLDGAEDLVVDCHMAAAGWPGLPPGLIAAVTAVSRIAGLHCPGRQALLRGFQIRPGVQSSTVRWHVARVRHALSFAAVDLSGGVSGSLEVMVRPAPAEQVSATDASRWMGAAEFAGVRALVVGGSRGLGLLAARLLAAGGGEVVSTSREGNGEWRADAALMGLDVTSPSLDAARAIAAFAPTHVLHFATPPIPRRLGTPQSPELLAAYDRVYSDGLGWLAAATEADILLPSSSFVDERPDGFAEYIAAKEHAEAVAKSINATTPRIMIERLPMLLTDQTTGATAMTAEGNVEVLLPVLRRFVAGQWVI